MDRDELLALFDREQRMDVAYPSVRREALPGLVRHVSLSGRVGFIVYSLLRADEVEPAAREQIAYFEALGQGFEWKVYDHDTPPDLRGRLVALGFKAEDAEAVMVLDLQEAPARLLAPVAHDVRRITDTADLDDVRKVKEAVWGAPFDDLIRELGDDLRAQPDLLSVYAAYADGQPVAAARISFHPGSQFAGLWGGGTLEAYRGRGIYHALVATRAQEAIRRGVRFLTVDASPMSRPILQRLGFAWLSNAHPCKWRVGPEAD